MMDTIIVNRRVLVNKKRGTFFYSFAAAIGIATGVISMIAALLLICISAVTGEGFSGAEVVLIVASFVLCFVGAHCLDSFDKRRKLQKRESINFRRSNEKIY